MDQNVVKDWDKCLRPEEDWPEKSPAELSCMISERGVGSALQHLAELLRVFSPDSNINRRLDYIEVGVKREFEHIKGEIDNLKRIIGHQGLELSTPKSRMTKDEIEYEYEKIKKRSSDLSLINEDDLKDII